MVDFANTLNSAENLNTSNFLNTSNYLKLFEWHVIYVNDSFSHIFRELVTFKLWYTFKPSYLNTTDFPEAINCDTYNKFYDTKVSSFYA